MASIPAEKHCCSCGKVKPASEFYKRGDREGIRGSCKACVLSSQYERRDKIREQKQRRYEATREEKLAKQKDYYFANREARLEYARRYREAHRETALAYNKAYYAANRQALLAQKQEYHAANPEVGRANARNRKARLRAAKGTHTADDVSDKYQEQRGKCYWCGKRLDGEFHVDHIIPIARAGSNCPSNICCACPFCNMSKHDKMPWEFSDRLF